MASADEDDLRVLRSVTPTHHGYIVEINPNGLCFEIGALRPRCHCRKLSLPTNSTADTSNKSPSQGWRRWPGLKLVPLGNRGLASPHAPLFRLNARQESINKPQDFAPEDFAAVYADTNFWLVVRLGHRRGASVRAADEKQDRCLLGGRPVRSLYAASRSHWSAMISNPRLSLSLRHAFAWRLLLHDGDTL